MEEQTQQDPATPEPQDELLKAQSLAEENMAGWKRAMADYANLKKENERDRAEIARYASATLIASLLPILDSFIKANAARPTDGDAQKMTQWADGIALVRAQFESAMKSAGVTVIDDSGGAFDPSKHEAMMMEKGDTPGVIIRVLEPGYKLHDRVLRPAKVVVSE